MNFQIEGKSFTLLKITATKKIINIFRKPKIIEIKLYFSKLKYTKEILPLTDKVLSQNKVILVLTFFLIKP